MKINGETIFDLLFNKQALLDNENIGFKNPQNWHFSKGLVHGFGQKLEIFLTFFFLCKILREKVFGDALVCKQAFLDNINMDLKWTQNWHFFKGDSPWFWSKIGNFLNVFFLGKILREKVFGDVLVCKQAFPDNINMDLKWTQNCHFSKGNSPWFWSKRWSFFVFCVYQKQIQKNCLMTF